MSGIIMTSRRFGRALTLVEVIVAMVILSIIGALVMVSASGNDEIDVMQAAKVVVKGLETVQSEAVTRKEPLTVVFNAASGSFEVKDATGVIDIVPGQPFTVDIGAESNASVKISSISLGSGSQVTFTADGKPVQGGISSTTPMPSNNKIVLTVGDYSRTVSIDPLTAKIKISK